MPAGQTKKLRPEPQLFRVRQTRWVDRIQTMPSNIAVTNPKARAVAVMVQLAAKPIVYLPGISQFTHALVDRGDVADLGFGAKRLTVIKTAAL